MHDKDSLISCNSPSVLAKYKVSISDKASSKKRRGWPALKCFIQYNYYVDIVHTTNFVAAYNIYIIALRGVFFHTNCGRTRKKMYQERVFVQGGSNMTGTDCV
jgi:hypothetical protein